jgi:peptidoglycan/LPS O-acetylase OafA/YrhL
VKNSAPQKNIEIEALRCFAVLIVVCGHSANLMPWHYGLANTSIGLWTGVDVFLCISGFVITKAFGDAIRAAGRAGRREWVDETIRFLVRRGFRLVPASLFWIAAAYAFSCLFNRSGAFGAPAQNLQDALAIVLALLTFISPPARPGSLPGAAPMRSIGRCRLNSSSMFCSRS